MDYSNYIIPFGKHKFTALCRIPAKYLLGLYGDQKAMENYPQIKHYIVQNLSRLKENQEKPHIKEKVSLPCDKISYIDEKAAKNQLKLVRKDERDHKKPIRAYLCDCGYWHLTSKPL